eukprot:scaffold52090_cov62-Attheya_sp.AAC.2
MSATGTGRSRTSNSQPFSSNYWRESTWFGIGVDQTRPDQTRPARTCDSRIGTHSTECAPNSNESNASTPPLYPSTTHPSHAHTTLTSPHTPPPPRHPYYSL